MSNGELIANCDASIFQYIIDYARCGNLPRNFDERCVIDVEDLIKIQKEANTLCLFDLSKKCIDIIDDPMFKN